MPDMLCSCLACWAKRGGARYGIPFLNSLAYAFARGFRLARQRSWIFFISTPLLRIKPVLPHLFLGVGLGVGCLRDFVAYAHVWAGVIVEVEVSPDDFAGMAEAFYEIPEELIEKAYEYLPGDMLDVIEQFYSSIQQEISHV